MVHKNKLVFWVPGFIDTIYDEWEDKSILYVFVYVFYYWI